MSQESNASGYTAVGQYDLSTFSILGRVAGVWRNLSAAFVQGIVRKVSHKTANYTVLDSESGTTFTNRGASGTITFTLPAAVVGLHYIFMVRATQQLRVDPNGSETLESTATPAVAGTAGQYINADAIGESIQMICLETGKWAVINFKGTWTVV